MTGGPVPVGYAQPQSDGHVFVNHYDGRGPDRVRHARVGERAPLGIGERQKTAPRIAQRVRIVVGVRVVATAKHIQRAARRHHHSGSARANDASGRRVIGAGYLNHHIGCGGSTGAAVVIGGGHAEGVGSGFASGQHLRRAARGITPRTQPVDGERAVVAGNVRSRHDFVIPVHVGDGQRAVDAAVVFADGGASLAAE